MGPTDSTRSLSTRAILVRLGLLPPLLLILACATSTAPAPRPAPVLPAVSVDHLEERALLLLLADRKTYEPFSINQALEGDASLRRQVALTLARIGDHRGGPTLELLLADPAPEVRRAAAFALGELGEQGYRQGAQALAGTILDADRETGRLAVEALAKLGVTLETVLQRLQQTGEEEILARLLPSLYRFQTDAAETPEEALFQWAETGLSRPGLSQTAPELRAMAAYALARRPRAQGLSLLRPLTADGDPWVRGWAARALGQIGDRTDVDRLRPLLDDSQPGPIIQALRAVRQLAGDGKTAAPASFKPRLIELLADPRPGVRLTAIEVSAQWLLDDDLGRILAAFATSGLRRERELALVALAEGEDPRAAVLVLRMAEDPDPVLRARAAESAGLFRSLEILDRLLADPDAGVRRAALEVRLAGEPPDARQLVRSALADPDYAVRAAAFSWAEDHPVLVMEDLLPALEASRRDRRADALQAGVRALAERGKAEPRERGTIVAVLEKLASEPDYLVRRQAVEALTDLDRKPPEVGAAAERKPVQLYREVVQRTHRPRQVDIVTERGTLRAGLACGEAPLTCLNFLQLAGQGFYEGLAFHRVVPDFVVQTGDPRGDGWGGPGYAIRDELNTLRYDSGVLGMALSGPDTGGSQFFITLSPQPHLDGGYTVFGRVNAGFETLAEIVQGDRILRIVEVSSR